MSESWLILSFVDVLLPTSLVSHSTSIVHLRQSLNTPPLANFYSPMSVNEAYRTHSALVIS